MRKLILALVAFGILAGGLVAYAAPTSNIFRNIYPETTNTYEAGTSTTAWLGVTSQQFCLTGDSCITQWPTGGTGGGGSTTIAGLTPSNGVFTLATGTATGLNLNISTTSPRTITLTPQLQAGYNIPLTASTTNWNGLYNTLNSLTLPVPVNQGGTGSTSLNTTLVPEGSNLYFTNARAQNAISLTTTGTSGAATYSGGSLNIPQYQAAGSYLTSVTADSPLSGSGTSGSHLVFTNPGYYLPSGFIAGSNITITTSTPGSITIAASGGGTPCTVTANSIQFNNGGSFGCVTNLLWNGSTLSNSATTTLATTTITQLSLGDGLASTFLAADTNGKLIATTTPQMPITLTTMGSSGAATFSGNTLNIPQYTGGGGNTNWSTSSPNIFYVNNSIVGINSTTPTADLAVQGISGSTTPIFIAASSTGKGYLQVGSTGQININSLASGQYFPVKADPYGNLYSGFITNADLGSPSGLLEGSGTSISGSGYPTNNGQLLMGSSSNWTIGNLIAGSNITITTSTPGQITIAATGGGGTPCTTTGYSLQYDAAGSFGCVATLITDGNLLGYNATSSTANINFQGTAGSNDILDVGSSTSADILQIAANDTAIFPMNASSTLSNITVATVPVIKLGTNALSSPNANGTYIGINNLAGFSGNYLDFQSNGTEEFSVRPAVFAVGGTNPAAGAWILGVNLGSGQASVYQGKTVAGNQSLFNIFNSSTWTPNVSATPDYLMQSSGTYQPTAAPNTFAEYNMAATINQLTTSSGTTRSLYITPTLTKAADYRALEVAPYTYNLTSNSVSPNLTTAYGSLFNAYTLATTSAVTIPNAQLVTIAGAPVAGNNIVIASTSALTINSSSTVSGNGSVVNAYSLYVSAPTGATYNTAAVFASGNVGIGSTTPGSNLVIQGTGTQTQNYFTVTSAGGTPVFSVASSTAATLIVGTPGTTSNPGCTEYGDSASTTITNYVYFTNAVQVATTTKPSFCQ